LYFTEQIIETPGTVNYSIGEIMYTFGRETKLPEVTEETYTVTQHAEVLFPGVDTKGNLSYAELTVSPDGTEHFRSAVGETPGSERVAVFWSVSVKGDRARDGRYSNYVREEPNVRWGQIGARAIWEIIDGSFYSDAKALNKTECVLFALDSVSFSERVPEGQAVTWAIGAKRYVQPVSVPAGKFADCLLNIRMINGKNLAAVLFEGASPEYGAPPDSNSVERETDYFRTETYFARDVGMIKEVQYNRKGDMTYSLELKSFNVEDLPRESTAATGRQESTTGNSARPTSYTPRDDGSSSLAPGFPEPPTKPEATTGRSQASPEPQPSSSRPRTILEVPDDPREAIVAWVETEAGRQPWDSLSAEDVEKVNAWARKREELGALEVGKDLVEYRDIRDYTAPADRLDLYGPHSFSGKPVVGGLNQELTDGRLTMTATTVEKKPHISIGGPGTKVPYQYVLTYTLENRESSAVKVEHFETSFFEPSGVPTPETRRLKVKHEGNVISPSDEAFVYEPNSKRETSMSSNGECEKLNNVCLHVFYEDKRETVFLVYVPPDRITDRTTTGP